MRSRRHPVGRSRPDRRGAMPRLHGVHGRLPVGRAGSRSRLPADCGAAPADRRADPGMHAPSPRSRNPRPLPGDALGRAPRVPLRLVPGTGFPGHRLVRRMRKRVRRRADEGSPFASRAGHLFALCRPLSFRDGAAGTGGTPLRSPFLLHGSQEEGRVAGGRKGRIGPRIPIRTARVRMSTTPPRGFRSGAACSRRHSPGSRPTRPGRSATFSASAWSSRRRVRDASVAWRPVRPARSSRRPRDRGSTKRRAWAANSAANSA